jgi:ribosomal-protein-alanine N-acetyltransferase
MDRQPRRCFYTAAAVRSSLEQAQWARNAQKEYHYLAWVNDAIVGRVTLRGAEREHYFKASLGYRFSAQHGGKGYATQAVSHVVEERSAHSISGASKPW